jgi:hypothetical protein
VPGKLLDAEVSLPCLPGRNFLEALEQIRAARILTAGKMSDEMLLESQSLAVFSAACYPPAPGAGTPLGAKYRWATPEALRKC